MDGLKRNVEELMLQMGVLVSAALAAVSWGMSSSTNGMLSTYIACLLPVLLVIVPDWTYFLRTPGEWADVIFVEPVIATKQIQRLALERDRDLLQRNGSAPERGAANSGPLINFMGSAIS